MPTETGSFRSRRALLGAALGGAAAVAATAARPLGALAATDGNVILGRGSGAGENEAGAPTIITNTTDAQVSLAGAHGAAGTGVQGTSTTGAGVRGGSTSGTGVIGASGDMANASPDTSGTGIYGYSNVSALANGVWGESVDGAGLYGVGYYGVYGFGGIAVQGDAGIDGVGVYGWTGVANPTTPALGVGVYARAESISQTALQVVGRLRLSRSGKLSMTRSQTSRKVTMTGVTTSSLVLAVLQTPVSGLYIRAVKPTTNAFTVFLSKAPGKTVYLSYMIING